MERFFRIRSFRQKFFLSYLVLLIVFLALMFPFVAASVQKIVYSSMNNRADELIAKFIEAQDEESLLQIIKDQKHYTFYRIGILDSHQRLLYDSHTKRLLRPLFFPLQFTKHPEVEEALKTGTGYAEEYSHILGQKLIYVAKSFDFHGKTYVVRLAFPYQYTAELRRNFEIGFVLFSSMVLILFTAVTSLVLHRLISPIRQIISAIKPYQQGKASDVPKIELNMHPQDEFSQLASTLNSVLEMKKDFIANASHELKTPITIIRGFAETLQDNPGLPQETISHVTERIVASCERMTKIIRNLLTLSDIENLPASRIGPCDLVELAMQCRQTLLSVHPKAQVIMRYDLGQQFEVRADVELLEVALMNLLDNAAKYSKELIEIEVIFERLENQVKISVRDNGIGIPENELERIFQRFYRVHKMHSKKLGGSGLGLSIVETIVEKHFGRVYVESQLGVGSTFTIHIASNL